MNDNKSPGYSSLDPAAVHDLVEAYKLIGDPDRTEELHGTLRLALRIQAVEGSETAVTWIRRQAALIREQQQE